MLLQHILELFDEELARLQQLRSIVSGLARPSMVLPAPPLQAPLLESGGQAKLSTGPSVPLKEASTAKAARPRRKRAAGEQPHGRRSSRRSEEASALRGSIPQGPVVVSAAQLQNRPTKAVPAPAQATPPERGSLGSMIRALRLEPSS